MIDLFSSLPAPRSAGRRTAAVLGVLGLALAALVSLRPAPAQAQGTVRAVISGVPPVLSTPYVDQIERNIRQGRYTTQITYTNPSGGPMLFRIRAALRYDGETVVETVSNPVQLSPGTYVYRTFDENPPVTFPESTEDLLDRIDDDTRDKVARTGLLPEGQYTIEVEAVPVERAAGVAPIPGTATTRVRYPQPPSPIAPADGSTVTTDWPVFTWTPVNGTGGDVFRYDLVLTEVLPGQTPRQAVQANRPVTGPTPISLQQQTTFTYTRDLPPLESGTRYAWQLRAEETMRDVPLSDDGESPVYTFTYQPASRQYDAPTLTSPAGQKAVPQDGLLEFGWTAATGLSEAENDAYQRLGERLVVKKRENGQTAGAAWETRPVLADSTLSFRPGQARRSALPGPSDTVATGAYVWAVQLVGRTRTGEERIITESRPRGFSVVPDSPDPPPVAGGESIRLTPNATLMDAASLQNSNDRYSGTTQLRLSFPGGSATVKTSVTDLQAVRDNGGSLQAKSGTVITETVSGLPAGTIPGLTVEQLEWSGNARSLTADVRITPQGPFACPDPVVDPTDASLTLGPEGFLMGQVSVDDPCAVTRGPFTITPTKTTLRLDRDADGQMALLESGASLRLQTPGASGASSLSASGRFVLNLSTGRFSTLSFTIDEAFDWGLPTENPVLSFRIQRAELDRDGLLIDGRNDLQLPDGSEIGTTFDSLQVALRQPGLRSGRIVFDEGFGLEVGMNDSGGGLDFRAVAPDASLSTAPGLLFTLSGSPTLDRAGLTASGTGTATLNFGSWSPDLSLTADFSPRFAMGLKPFAVASGRMDLQFEDSKIGYVDKNGFHPSSSALSATLPDRIPLPTEQVAYLQLKRNGQPLATMSRSSGGTATIQTKPGKTIDLVVPALKNDPALKAQLDSVRVNTTNGFQVTGGTVTARVSGAPMNLTKQGIPLGLERVRYGQITVGSTTRTGLFLEGNLAVFGSELTNANDVTFAVDGAGAIQGSVDLPNINEQIPLAGGGTAALTLKRVSGSVTLPANGPPSFSFSIGSAFALRDGPKTLASADVGLRFTDRNVTVQTFTATTNIDTPPLKAGRLGLDVTGIHSVKNVSYTRTNGFGFRVGLDLRLDLPAPNGKTFQVPLTGVEVFREAKAGRGGITLPKQAIHAQTKPSLDEKQTLTVGPVDLRLFNAELTDDVTIDIFGGSTNVGKELHALTMDLGLTINSFPQLAGEELTVYDAGFEDGAFTGRLEPFGFLDGQEPTISLGPTAGIKVDSIGGALTQLGPDSTGRQGFDIQLDGTFDLPDAFRAANDSAQCAPMNVSVGLARSGGVEGTISNFAPCGSIAFGPATLSFPSSTLTLAHGNGTQEATLDGRARAVLEGVNDSTLTATGSAKMDLLTGRLLSGSITFNGAFDYDLPQQNPVFTFRVTQATLGASGLTFSGSGSIPTESPGGASAPDTTSGGTQTPGIQFSQFTVHPDSGIVSGSATLQSKVGLEVGLQQGQVDWRMIPPSSPVPQNPALRLTLPASLTLNAQGLSIGGSATASLGFNQKTYASLTAAFQQFRLGLTPVGVDRGRVDLTTEDGTRIAYYDQGGFHFDAAGTTLATLPDRLGLPTQKTAYLKLRDDQDNLLIDYEPASGGGYKISSATGPNGQEKDLELVLAGLGSAGNASGAPPTVQIAISQDQPLVVDDAFQQIRSGKIAAAVNKSLVQGPNIPLRLKRIIFEKQPDGTYALTADGAADLPEGLGGEQVSFQDLGFGPDGFTGTLSAGVYDNTSGASGSCRDVPASTPASPIASAAYANQQLQANPSTQTLSSADLAVRLHGLRYAFPSQGSATFAVVGSVSSRLLNDGKASQSLPDEISFTAGYANGTWTADLCTDLLPSDTNGDGKVSLQLANLYLDDNVGGGVGLEVGSNTLNLRLSGTARFPDVMGESFAATVQDLKVGSVGVDVGTAQAATGGQAFRLFNGEVKVATDAPPQGFQVRWDTQNEDLVLSMSGKLWLTALMDPTQPSEAAQFQDLSVTTGGDVSLGSASGNLLSGNRILAIGSKAEPTLTVSTLQLETPSSNAALALKVGGSVTLPEMMDGVSSSYAFRLATDGTIRSKSPLRFRFAPDGAGPNDPVDAIGDNPKTEFDFGNVATMDVKEAGIAFNGGQLDQPAVYANGAAYVQPDGNTVDDLVRLGTLGSRSASASGLYVGVGSPPRFNATSEIDDFELFGFLTLSEMSVQLKQEDGLRKVVLGGKIGAKMDGIGGASGRWAGLKISREGIKKGDMGRLDGGLSLTLADVLTVSMNDLDYGRGTFSQGDSTVTAERYFRIEGATLDLAEIGKGEVDAAYYYVTAGGAEKAIGLYAGTIELKDMATATASFAYRKNTKSGAMELFAAGQATFGTEQLTISGAFTNDGSGKIRYGLFASLQSAAGIPVAPGVTVTGIGGGFFYRPKAKWVKNVKTSAFSGSEKLLPAEPKGSPASLKFAAYLNGSALVGGVQAEVLIEGTDQHTSLYGVGNLKGMKNIVGAGMRLTVHYGQRAGVDGGAVVDVGAKPVLDGRATLNFAAYVNKQGGRPPVRWFVEGQIGQNGPFQVYIYQADGSFLVSNQGLLLKEISVGMGTPDLGVVNISAAATASFWVVPQKALGAYAKIGVDASLFGGLAKLGANLRGAYIRSQKLIYVAAEAYVKVVGVFNGNVGLWAAVEDGDVRGGRGSNERYDRMVSDAQKRAQQMIAETKKAMQKMEAIETAPIQVSQDALTEAGVNALHPEEPLGDGVAEQIYRGLKQTEGTTLSSNEQDALTAGFDILTSKPSNDRAKTRRQVAETQLEAANQKVDAVTQHLQAITQKQIRWSNQASETLRRLTLRSPVSNVQSAQYSGSGDNRRLQRSPSWNVDEQAAQDQAQGLADLKADIDVLNESYQKSLAAVAENLKAANRLFGADVGGSGSGQTSVNDLADTFDDAMRNKRGYYAERADVLWSTAAWAEQGQSTLQAQQGAIRSAVQQAAQSGSRADRRSVLLSRYDAFTQLAPTKNGLAKRSQFKQDLSSLSASNFARRHKKFGEWLWLDVFQQGLAEVEKQAEGQAGVLYARAYKATQNDAYASFTRRIDAAYAAKHQLLTTYYGMIESYRGWRQDAGLAGSSGASASSSSSGSGTAFGGGSDAPQIQLSTDARLAMRLDSLENVLQPPTVRGIQATRSHDSFSGSADLTLQAQHPEAVAEISYTVDWGSGYRLSTAGPFYSIGDRTSFTVHTFAKNRDQDTQDLTVTVRARGAGGSTITRQADVTLAVSDQGTGSAPDGSAGNVLPTDSSPPSDLTVDFPYLSTSTDQVEIPGPGAAASNQGGPVLPVGMIGGTTTVPVQRFWTNSASVVRVEVEAFDEQSDIAGYAYKIGTSKGAGDVRDWTPLQGTPISVTTGAGTFTESGLKATIRGLRFEEGTSYYVTVRAQNGAGGETVHEVDLPILYDGTAPTRPEQASNPVDTGPEADPRQSVVDYDAVSSPPTWKGLPASASSGRAPSLSVRWQKASDDGAGIQKYEYVVTRDDPEKPFEAFGADRRVPGVFSGTSETIRGDWLSYTDSVWVHVQAVDHAGNRGDPLTIGPVRPNDASMPHLPEVHPMVVEDGVRVYVQKPAYDLESGIRGYQVRIRKMSGATWYRRPLSTVKSYPSGSTVDVGPQCPQGAYPALASLTATSVLGTTEAKRPGPEKWSADVLPMGCSDSGGSTAPFFFLSAKDLPNGVPLRIEVTPVNGQGARDQGSRNGGSGPVRTEDVVLDASDPKFGASASRPSGSDDVKVRLSDVHDPESGIAKVEVKSGLASWREIAAPQDPPTSPKDVTFTVQRSQSVGGGLPSVSVRVTNGVGRTTVQSVSIQKTVGDDSDTPKWGDGQFSGLDF
jgi:hypothetical protein